MKIGIIGAGASGLMAAYFSAKGNNEVTVLEKSEKAGKKIYITGKGRCNITNTNDNFLENVVNNSKFLYTANANFNFSRTIDTFESLGLRLKQERGGRIFPASDKASDVTKTLEKACINSNVKFIFNEEVEEINKENNIFSVKTNNSLYFFDAVIIATGGMSYPSTGSTGSGYEFARKFSHTIIKPICALVPIKVKNPEISKFEGISLKNVMLSAFSNNKLVKSIFGEMLFTKDGISGPIALSLSSYINRLSGVSLVLDFKPALSNEKLLARIEREIEQNSKCTIQTVMRSLLPKNMVNEFLNITKTELNTKVNLLTKEDKLKLVFYLKNYPLIFGGLNDFNNAIVTSGGVSCKEVNPKNMESKLVNNLFFTGEVLDLDALTGGFNLQIAWSTGYLAGKYLSEI